MLILDKLWRGMLMAGETQYRSGKEYDRHVKQLESCKAIVDAELSDTGKTAFSVFISEMAETTDLSNCDSLRRASASGP